MLLAADVGNTNVVFALFEPEAGSSPRRAHAGVSRPTRVAQAMNMRFGCCNC